MASKRILIVDDEENIGRSLRMILEREGYAVNFCRSVAEFTKHPDAGRADAYLLDMKLPDGSGIDLLKAVKQNGTVAPAIMNSMASAAFWMPPMPMMGIFTALAASQTSLIAIGLMHGPVKPPVTFASFGLRVSMSIAIAG